MQPCLQIEEVQWTEADCPEERRVGVASEVGLTTRPAQHMNRDGLKRRVEMVRREGNKRNHPKEKN
jgi:hypothetical protein